MNECHVFLAGIGWRAEVHPRTHPVNELEFDVIIGADGRRNTLAGRVSWTGRTWTALDTHRAKARRTMNGVVLPPVIFLVLWCV